MTSRPTHTGDDGSTGMLGKDRLQKHHPIIETIGCLDEASAALGLARSLCQAPDTASILIESQRDLYKCMAEIAATPDNVDRFKMLDRTRVEWLEIQINTIEKTVPLPTEFILPGDTPSGAALALARTIVRRAERRVSELISRGDINNPILLQYLNRLSTLCFSLELLENQHSRQKTSLAKK